MRGAVPPLTNTPSRRGAKLKHRNNFIFTLPLLCSLLRGNQKERWIFVPRLETKQYRCFVFEESAAASGDGQLFL
jgi:hypothetical protein